MTTTEILLVEDNAFDAKFFRRSIRHSDLEAEVTVATDGIGALARLRGRGDVRDLIVVTDLNMPRMDGIELLEQIRAAEELADLPVFVLTTSTLPEDQDMAQSFGIEGYLTKTSDERGIADEIAAYLARRRSH
jgi:CheY-like chemotaxis protein